jgi:hypothetical protein
MARLDATAAHGTGDSAVREDGRGGHSQRDISGRRDEAVGTGAADRLPLDPRLRFPRSRARVVAEERHPQRKREGEGKTKTYGGRSRRRGHGGRERKDRDRNAKGAGDAMAGTQAKVAGQKTGCANRPRATVAATAGQRQGEGSKARRAHAGSLAGTRHASCVGARATGHGILPVRTLGWERSADDSRAMLSRAMADWLCSRDAFPRG